MSILDKVRYIKEDSFYFYMNLSNFFKWSVSFLYPFQDNATKYCQNVFYINLINIWINKYSNY